MARDDLARNLLRAFVSSCEPIFLFVETSPRVAEMGFGGADR